MILYHYTARRYVSSILTEGISLGGLLLQERISKRNRLLLGFMWLTMDPDFNAQSWDVQQIIPYSRTDVRFEVVVPAAYHAKLYDRNRLETMMHRRWQKFYVLHPGIAESWNPAWHLYNGVIAPEWIKSITERTPLEEQDNEKET